MPETGAILWGIIAASFVVLLAVVGWFLDKGVNRLDGGVKDLASEVKGLRSDIGRYHDSEMETRGTLKAHIDKCEERHKHIFASYAISNGGNNVQNP